MRSNGIFIDSYWKNTKIKACKADGSKFGRASFKEMQIEKSNFNYTNCVNTLWQNSVIKINMFQAVEISKLLGVKVV